jgi:hypothetical protein
MKGRTFGVVAAVVAILVVLGVSTHAAAGAEPHTSGSGCLACAVCDWLNAMLG